MASRKYISDRIYLRRLEEVFDPAVDGVSPPGTGTRYAAAAIGAASPRGTAEEEGTGHATETSSEAEAEYESVMVGTAPAEPAHLNARTLSMFLHDAAARGTSMEPNFLKSTEIHVISRPLSGISDRGFVAHYLRFNHSLELRADIDLPEDFLGVVREGWFFVGLSTAFNWLPRRAFSTNFPHLKAFDRNIELGRAVGSVTLAAAALGWEARLLGPSLAFVSLKRLLGLQREADLMNEMPAAAILVFRRPPDNPDGAVLSMRILNSKIIVFFNESIQWRGRPCNDVNALTNWTDNLSRSLIKTQWTGGPELVRLDRLLPAITVENYKYNPGATLRRALSSRGSIPVEDFDENYCTRLLDFQQFVLRCCPNDLSEADAGGWGACFPHGTLPWPPRMNVFFYVNRVEGLEPGLYCLVRNRRHLQNVHGPSYLWKPTILSHRALGAFYLFRLRDGPMPPFKTEHTRCSFIVAMVAPSAYVIEETYYMYSRQMWEAGFLGEVLAVEAQAQGVSAAMIPTGDYHFNVNQDPLETVMGIDTASGVIICAYAVGKEKQRSFISAKLLTALFSLCPWAAFRNFLA